MNEITWSLMHPTPLDADYFRRVLDASRGRRVDGFELCGEAHGPDAGMDGLLDYSPYRHAAETIDPQRINKNRAALREITESARAEGKSVLLWHREVVLPEAILKDRPGLLDEEGEFNFFGTDYTELLRYKIAALFDACPELDGIVLTLTEAQYSVIHPLRPDRYPVAETIAHIVALFAGELQSRGKRLVMRTFGSTVEDYENLMAGAELAGKKCAFDVETKVTTFDFIPFFDENPYMRVTPGCTLSVEFDGMGEFLGAGYFPAAGFDDLLRRVESAQAAGAVRYSLRMDRIGNTLLDASHREKLRIFEVAVDHGTGTAREALLNWANEASAGRGQDLLRLFDTGWQATLNMLYAGGNLTFHTNPPAPRLKWLKAGGFFGVLKGTGDLSPLKEIWALLADQPAPSRADLLREKEEAVALCTSGMQLLADLEPSLDPDLTCALRREWDHLEGASSAIRDFVLFAAKALDDMESLHNADADLAPMRLAFIEKFNLDAAQQVAPDSDAIEHDLFQPEPPPLKPAWIEPLAVIMGQILAEYPVELALRKEFSERNDVEDFIVAGGIGDDWRIGRFMHASHAAFDGKTLSRTVGNRLFPDGFIRTFLNRTSAEPASLLIRADGSEPVRFSVEVNGESLMVETGPQRPEVKIPLAAEQASHPLHITVRKTASACPRIQVIALCHA